MQNDVTPSDSQAGVLVTSAPSTLAECGTVALSAGAHEFLGRAPHWMVRSGLSMVAAMLVLLFALGVIIKYPDTITGRITITGTQPEVKWWRGRAGGSRNCV